MSTIRPIRNREFRKLMADAGLADVELVKGNGYHYITSDDSERCQRIYSLTAQSIYVCHFNELTPAQWVEEIKGLLKAE